MPFLITKWFGCFLYEENGSLLKQKLFPNHKEKMLNKLKLMKENIVLPEEKDLAAGIEDLIVSEKRLRTIGSYKPNHPFFRTIKIFHMDYNFTQEDFIDITKEHAKEIVNVLLLLPDHQIIQKVHAIDDLIQTSNLLMERITAWSIFPKSDQSLDHLKELVENIDKELLYLQESIKGNIEVLTPNMASLVGPMITAKLIAQAGSMHKLAMMPASSIQLLGAEKALFRYKKEGGKPPKHGIIFQHNYICNAPRYLRGKISRLLALKISLAIKADIFTKRIIVDELKKDLLGQIDVLKKTVNV